MPRLGSLLARVFSAVPKEERTGISMGNDAGWKISGIQGSSFPEFLALLPSLLPQDSVLYLEGTSPSVPDVITFLENHRAVATSKVARGTIWPRPKILHIKLAADVMRELARLVEGRPTYEICSHLHVYRDRRVLLEWYDAFFQPLELSRDIPESKVAEFCQHLGAKYESSASI